MIGNLNKTKELLKKHEVSPNKSLGQNFLVDQNILNLIVKNANLDTKTGVIEIGPGLGALTEHLANTAKQVLAYEIDEGMVRVLNDSLSKYRNVKVKHEDFLKVDVLSDIKKYLNDCEKVVVVANLPYYITTKIIFKLLELEFKFEKIILMVQSEIADRFTGKPKTKDYNALSVVIDYMTTTKKLFGVSARSFYPIPNVSSSVIEINQIKPNFDIENDKLFIKFINSLFIQRRKTIVNNLVNTYSLRKDEVISIVEESGYLSTARAEELNTSQIVSLYKNFKKKLN